MKRFTLFACLLALLTLAFGLTAQASIADTAKASGTWSSASTWSMGVPTSTLPVFIAAGYTVTVDIDTAVCSTLCLGHIGSPTTGFGILVFNA